ncbi:putative membrane protein YccC [Methylorubrum extorquens]|uniref:FUSC family protein n=1 Tax=Methylorubrum extorquens TaxID=408 RepID=UPI00209EEABF|nr:FUSC family protein [Methylorubrum extorquens]MDF9794674.1 putative membrane protein YccC [Methylorubrum extorquens]MDF9866384.1 putative membrane protein YccC [Methylorubrum pseudosasae]MDH6669117.1 putative membrane protein YccC [Methylorubrum zatmanii]
MRAERALRREQGEDAVERAAADAVRAEAAVEETRRADRDTSRIRWLRDQVTRLRKRLPLRRRFSGGLAHGVMSAVAAIVAYLPTQVLGLREGFWAAITAVAVAQTEFGATRSTARDQFSGAAIGGLIGLAAYLTLGPSLPTYAATVVLAILACWLVNVASACRLAGITATIILLVPHLGPVERMAGSRVLEVGWGVCVAIGTVWLMTRLNRRLGIKL